MHCHQYQLAATQLAIVAGAALGKRVYVTDRGGCGHHVDPEVPVSDCVTEFLPISRFSVSLLPPAGRMHVIRDGVSPHFMGSDGAEPCDGRVLYVGRVMRHKGIDVLIARCRRTWASTWSACLRPRLRRPAAPARRGQGRPLRP